MKGRVKQISLDIVLGENELENILNEVKEFIFGRGYYVVGSDENDVTDLYSGYDVGNRPAVVIPSTHGYEEMTLEELRELCDTMQIARTKSSSRQVMARKLREKENSLSNWSDIIVKPGTKI
jgi:hypothetical protein